MVMLQQGVNTLTTQSTSKEAGEAALLYTTELSNQLSPTA